MTYPLRRFGAVIATALAVAGAAAHAADPYPTRPLRWVVPYAPGGGSDILARTVAGQLSQQLGQSVVVENRPGGATVIAAEMVAKSPPDGYTVMNADNGTLVFNTALFRRLPYDPQKDFAPIGLIARFPLVLAANPDAGFATARQLVEALRGNPGRFNYASAGIGSPHHLAMEMFKERNKLFATHIAYRGAAPAMQDVASGQVPMMVIDTAAGLPLVRSGKLKPLAVFSKTRLALLPEVPTLAELGYADIEAYAWQGMVVPAATPKDVTARLTAELQKAVGTPAIRTKLQEMGLEPTPSDAADMASHWASEARYWPNLIRDRQISLD